jgi:putative heme degradation protein
MFSDFTTRRFYNNKFINHDIERKTYNQRLYNSILFSDEQIFSLHKVYNAGSEKLTSLQIKVEDLDSQATYAKNLSLQIAESNADHEGRVEILKN